MEINDHDLLIRIDTKLDELSKQFTNHLRHHFLFSLTALSMAGAAIVALIVALI